MEYYLPQPGQSARKGNRVRNMILGGFGCLLVLGGIIAFVVYRLSVIAGDPSRAVRHHLNSINQGHVQSAYGDFTVDYKKKRSMEEFRKDLTDFSYQLPCRSSRLSRITVLDGKAEVGGTLTGKDGSLFPVEYELIREKGEWKIQDYHWEPPGDQQKI